MALIGKTSRWMMDASGPDRKHTGPLHLMQSLVMGKCRTYIRLCCNRALMLDSIKMTCPPSRQSGMSSIKHVVRAGFFWLICDAAIRHLLRLPVLQWPAERRWLLITGLNTGKHPAAALPVREARPRQARLLRTCNSLVSSASSRLRRKTKRLLFHRMT